MAGARVARLAPTIKAVLTEAIAAGGSSLRDYVRADGEIGRFQENFAVYGREGEACPGCPGHADCPGGQAHCAIRPFELFLPGAAALSLSKGACKSAQETDGLPGRCGADFHP